MDYVIDHPTIAWASVTKEQAVAPDANPFVTYIGEKKYAELAVWEFADKHPHVDITSGSHRLPIL